MRLEKISKKAKSDFIRSTLKKYIHNDRCRSRKITMPSNLLIKEIFPWTSNPRLINLMGPHWRSTLQSWVVALTQPPFSLSSSYQFLTCSISLNSLKSHSKEPLCPEELEVLALLAESTIWDYFRKKILLSPVSVPRKVASRVLIRHQS